MALLIYRLSPGKEPCHQNPDEPEEEDEDVQAERERVRQAIASQNQKEVKQSSLPVYVSAYSSPVFMLVEMCTAKRIINIGEEVQWFTLLVFAGKN